MSDTTLRFVQQENARLAAENQTLREENAALRHYMTALKDLAWATRQITDQNELLALIDHILYSAMGVLGAEGGSLLLLDEETNELAFVLAHGDVEHKLRGYRIERNLGIAGWVATHSEPLIINNPRQDPRFSAAIDNITGYITRSILCVPMVARGQLLGVIELLNKRSQQDFTEADATLLSILGQVAAMALEEMEIRLEIQETA